MAGQPNLSTPDRSMVSNEAAADSHADIGGQHAMPRLDRPLIEAKSHIASALTSYVHLNGDPDKNDGRREFGHTPPAGLPKQGDTQQSKEEFRHNYIAD